METGADFINIVGLHGTIHIVQPNESLATAFGLEHLWWILFTNDITDLNLIMPGDVLFIPDNMVGMDIDSYYQWAAARREMR